MRLKRGSYTMNIPLQFKMMTMKFLFSLIFVFAGITGRTQTTITFDLTKNPPDVFNDNTKIDISATPDIAIPNGKKLIFKIKLEAGKNLALSIEKRGSQSIVLAKKDFKQNAIETDQHLNLKGLNMEGAITISIDDPNYKQTFKFIQSPVTTPANTTTATNTDDNSPNNNNKDKSDDKPKTYLPGCVVDDALTLSNPKKISSAEWDNIIRFYLNKPVTVKQAELKDSLKKIPFLKDAADENRLKKLIDSVKNAAQSNPFSVLASLSSSSIGGLDVTNIADGFAKFIVKRTKQELSISFFRKFKEELNKYRDLRTVFPNTYNILQAIDEQIYNYSNYINNLREAFRSDLLAIDENLPGIVDNHPDFFKKKNNFELGLALRTGGYVSSSLRHDVHPGDILDNYPVNFFKDAPADKPGLQTLKGCIQSLQLFSEAMKETDTSKHSYWVNIEKVRQLINDKAAFKIYIGLVLQLAHNKYDGVKFGSTSSLYEKLNNSNIAESFDKDYASYKQYVLTLGNKVSELNKMVAAYEKPASDSLKVEQYAKYFKTSSQFIQFCVQVTDLPHIDSIPGLKGLSDTTKKYFDISYEVADLATAINRKRYPEVVNHLIVIYNKIVSEPAAASVTVNLNKSQKKALAEKVITENLTNPNVSTSSVINSIPEIGNLVNVAKDQNANVPNSSKILAGIAKYGAFMSNIIDAKNSDEVEKAIESVALPVGSARIKRETPFNVSLNAYAGFFIGHEYVREINDKHTINSYGATAPIGVAISWGKKCGWSSSLFISLVDLGAVAAFRAGNDSIAEVPTIKLKDIFSPGAFLSIGIPKTPVSFNVGAQFGPNLRKVEAAKNDYSDKKYVRFSASICVDIPVLNFYTKSK